MTDDWSSDPGPSPPFDAAGEAPVGSSRPEGGGSGPTGPSDALLPPPPAGTPPGPRHRLLLAVAIATVLAMVAAVLVVGVRARDTEGVDLAELDRRSAEEDEAPSPGSGSGQGGDLEEVVAELQEYVESERGLDFKEPVEVVLLDDAAFTERFLADYEEGQEEREEAEAVLRALALIEPDVDLDEELRELLDVGVVGFYDPETDDLVVRGTELTPYVRQTIVHELVHALEDQWFELDRPELDEVDDESGFTFLSLVEGSATRIENRFPSSLSEAEQQQLDEEGFEQALDFDVTSFPPVLIDLITAPYVLGEQFVDILVDERGDEALDDVFDDPPTTTEQLLDPLSYVVGEEALPVAAPPAGGEIVDEGMLGQLDLVFILSEELDGDDVIEAARGWGGGWYVVWRDGGRTCVRADVVGDTSRDTRELADALGEWAEAHPDAEVDLLPDDLVRFTACAG